ncbi:MAG TPA: tetratricopeptide repeat protein [Terriglobia bacterium]|nr:tetratricopeptide repeat protein [Terriglobia bacterium]
MRTGLAARLVWVLMLSAAAGPLKTAAQAISAPQSQVAAGAKESLPVYVADFSETRSGASLGELGSLPTLVTGIIQLRLLQVPSLTVRRVQTTPPCGPVPAAKLTAQEAPAPQFRKTGAPTGDFYVVRGSIEPRLPEFVVDYFVEKCVDQGFQTVVEDTVPFTADHALDQLTTMAHAIAFRLERSVPPTTVVVDAFATDSDAQDRQEVRDGTQSRVTEALSESPDLVVADSGNYHVGGELSFEKSGSRLRVLAKWDTVRANLYILAHGKKYPLQPVTGSRDAEEKFYGDVASQVARDLPEVLLAENLGWNDLLGNMQTKVLLSQGERLLESCSNDNRTCDAAQEAIPLLAAASQKDPSSEEGFRLLGRADMRAGKYAEAAKALEQANTLIKERHGAGRVVAPKTEIGVLNLLGDAYRSLEKYQMAEAAYTESLRIMPSQPDVHISKALALRDDGRRAGALGTLLDGLQFPASEAVLGSLHSYAKDTIRTLQPDEFASAEEAVKRAAGTGIPVNDEYALLLSREQGKTLDEKWEPETGARAAGALQKALDLGPTDLNVRAEVYANLARAHLLDKDPEQIDSYLTQAEKLPPDAVSADNREWIARIRTRAWLNQNQYAKAYAAADVARQIKATDDAEYLEALAALFWARDQEKVAGPNPTVTQKEEAAKHYQQTVDLAGPLVDKRFPDADGVLMEANHALGLDAKTRDRLRSLAQQNPKDGTALESLMFVCEVYLSDFGCAFSAAQLDAAAHDPGAPDAASAYVNFAEAAILVGNDAQTQAWLGIAIKQPDAKPRDRSLVYLYALWLALRQGETGEAPGDFQTWQKAAGEFRQANADLNWNFVAAKKALSDSSLGESQKKLLAAMMDALEDNSHPIPRWVD